MEFIEPRLIDDIIHPADIEDLERSYLTWFTNGWKSDGRLPYEYGHGQHYIGRPSKNLCIDLTLLPRFKREHGQLLQVFDSIQEIIGPRGLFRCYAKSYHYGQDAYQHTDLTGSFTMPDGTPRKEVDEKVEGFETCIIYMTKDWKSDYYGHTVLYTPDDELALSIMPKYNRMFVFDSAQKHASVPLSRMCPVNKNILVFNTIPSYQSDDGFNFLLKHCSDVTHSGKPFIEHLWNVFETLEEMKAKPHVALAGLWHSAYGTVFYQKHDKSVFTRDKVKSFIGEEAEDLVYRFCELPKNRVEKIIELNDVELAYIEVANLLDQNFNGRFNEDLAKLKLMTQQDYLWND